MRALLASMLLCFSVAAWPQTIATQDSVTPAVRSEIAHIKELIQVNDRRYEQRFAAQEKAVADALVALEKTTAQALTAAKEAVIKAEMASEKRFESVNEFRNTLRDQQNTLMSRTEAEARITSLTERVQLLQARVDRTEGKGAGVDALWGYIVGALGVIIAIVSLYLVTRKAAA